MLKNQVVSGLWNAWNRLNGQFLIYTFLIYFFLNKKKVYLHLFHLFRSLKTTEKVLKIKGFVRNRYRKNIYSIPVPHAVPTPTEERREEPEPHNQNPFYWRNILHQREGVYSHHRGF